MALRQVITKLQLASTRGWLISNPSQLQLSAIASGSSAWITVDGSMDVPRQASEGRPLDFCFRGYHNLLASLELPTRRGHFSELPLVSEMLPNRKQFEAQFSPHGITLVPKAITLAAPPTAAALHDTPIGEPEDENEQAPLQAIGVKTWRRLKMKKHKIRKRRKAARHKVK